MQLVFASLPAGHRDAFIHIFADSSRAHRICCTAKPVSSNILPPTPARPSTFLCPRNVPGTAAPSISQGDNSRGFMQQPVSCNPKGEADGAQCGLMSVVSKPRLIVPAGPGFYGCSGMWKGVPTRCFLIISTFLFLSPGRWPAPVTLGTGLRVLNLSGGSALCPLGSQCPACHLSP